MVESVKETYELIADSWNERHSVPKRFFPLFSHLLKPSFDALDAGGGNAVQSIAMAGKCKRVVCMDFSPKMLECAKRNVEQAGVKNVELVEGDLLSMPFAGASFDFVLAAAVVHHLMTPKEQLAAFKEIRRVLKPGCKAFVTVWSKKRKGMMVKDWVNKTGERIERLYYFFEPHEIRGLAENAGFKVEEFVFEKGGERVPEEKAMNYCLILRK